MVARIYSEDWHDHVIPVPWSGCWLWEGPVRSRYGYHTLRGVDRIVHRLAWEEVNGRVPDGKVVCHHCDVPLCCNPWHLFVGTQRDNLNDMMAKGRSRHGQRVTPGSGGIAGVTHCIHGHEYTAENTGTQAAGKQRYCRECRRIQGRIQSANRTPIMLAVRAARNRAYRARLKCQE